MSLFRQAVMLLLAVVLSAGPLLAQCEQMSCSPQKTGCAMCCRGGDGMRGMPMPGTQVLEQYAAAGSVSHQQPGTACLCGTPKAVAVVVAQNAPASLTCEQPTTSATWSHQEPATLSKAGTPAACLRARLRPATPTPLRV